ncbi:PEP-CTERM sorting domain-containing protein [Luteolibacter luteus]|uniref:PEP-CTERM sorting domain-containing protein n=1 Tax=Luteolibacter luteus TaxID=2728835 RepID=UPI003CCD38F7
MAASVAPEICGCITPKAKEARNMKIPSLFALVGLLTLGSADAATVTVSAGLPNQGFRPTNPFDGLPLANFTLAVGTWDSATQVFNSFGSLVDTGEANGEITASGPSSFNSQEIAVFIGSGTSIQESGPAWVVFTAPSPVFFPPDVSLATGVIFNLTIPSEVEIVGTGHVGNILSAQTGNGYALSLIPEPSGFLLGALGMAGFFRRRR